MFIEGDAIDGAAVGSSSQSNTETVRRLAEELELRLRTVREESFAANEELRAANEELQSINEEYRSTSEELKTSKEELSGERRWYQCESQWRRSQHGKVFET
jgi:two-component system, chemotaxis family, CheB/CheR fusion protein